MPSVVSVIIPTYRDTDELKLCLKCLLNQTIDPAGFRIIVCNNDPSTKLAEVAEQFPTVTFITEPKPGSYSARNAAVMASNSAIVAFTDADCQPEPTWLQNGLLHINHGADLVAGHVELIFESKSLSAAECYEKAFGFDQKSNVKKGVSVTANLIARRECFLTVGYFNSALMSGGDIDWTKKATDSGLSLVYGEDCVVRHRARSSIKQILKKAKRVAGGLFMKNDTPPTWRLVILFVLPPTKIIRQIFTKPKMSVTEKCQASLIAYLVKLVYYIEILKLKMQITSPKRS